MFEICFILGWLFIVVVVLIMHKLVWGKRHEALAKHFDGQISSDGCSVDFYWQGIKFSVTRASPGTGMSGNGTYGALLMFIKDSINLTISLDHMKRLQIKASDEVKQNLLDAISSDKDLEIRLKESLSVTNSTIECSSRTDVDGINGLKKVHLLSIHGLSVPYLKQPATLEREIDTLILLSRALNLKPTVE